MDGQLPTSSQPAGGPMELIKEESGSSKEEGKDPLQPYWNPHAISGASSEIYIPLSKAAPSTPECERTPSGVDDVDKPFRAIDFAEPLREVRRLIYDDWGRFTQSKHWYIFVADLKLRCPTEVKEDEHDPGNVTEINPVDARIERSRSDRVERSKSEHSPAPDVLDNSTDFHLSPSLTSNTGPSSPSMIGRDFLIGRVSSVLKTNLSPSNSSHHPDAA